ncbi:MAG: NAD kinase [Bacteroidetes bacterium]|nr:MAG: NAD kinase [Bacteroidota bacterium]
MKIAIYGRTLKEDFYISFQELLQKMKANKIEIIIYQPLYDCVVNKLPFELNISGVFNSHNDINDVDFMFSIGGDGTFLETISLVRNKNIPIVGINTGRLGFLSDISKDEISTAVDNFLENKYTIEKRALLQLNTTNQQFKEFNYALNEVTIHKKDTSSLITIHVYINNEYLNSYWADGLVISTPTGSTAYSMSLGGPIVVPNSQNFIITPIASHNLTVRPIVIHDSNVLKIKVEGRSKKFLVSLDSKSLLVDSDVELTIKKAQFSINILKFKNKTFFTTLRNKLMWGIDKRN